MGVWDGGVIEDGGVVDAAAMMSVSPRMNLITLAL